MDMFSQNEIILMIGVVSALLICITILTILDIKEYLKAKKEDNEKTITFGEEFKDMEEEINPVQVTIVQDEKKVDDEILLSDISDEESKRDDILLEDIEEDKLDLEKIVNPVIIDKKETNIAEIEVQPEEIVPKEKKSLDILEELDEIENNLPNNKDDVTNFEMEQERTAIISLDELLRKSDELYNSNEIVQYDDGDEPITIDEVIYRFNKENEVVPSAVLEEKEVPEVMQDIVKEKIEPYSRKETIPFISSVYGIEKKDNALEFENTATYEKLDRANYNDFIAKLREMNDNK